MPRYFLEREPTSPVNYRYPVERVLYRQRSAFQKILVFDSPGHGRVLALDDIVQLTTREEVFYHEALVHPALQAHPAPRRVLVVGGGDGGAVRELVKYPDLELIIQAELDEEVVRVASRFFPEVASGYRDPRVRLVYENGARFLRRTDLLFDIIILDLTDPLGPARPLFQEPFYRLCAEHLTDSGIVSAQTESLHYHRTTVARVYRALARVFAHVEWVWVPLAMYPGNWWIISLGSLTLDPTAVRNPTCPRTEFYLRGHHNWHFVPSELRAHLLSPSKR